MKFLLFGKIGSGKSFIGELLQRDFNIPYHDADLDLPSSIIAAIKNRDPITDEMRDVFIDAIIERAHSLALQHTSFCIAQAVFKNTHRRRILDKIPDMTFVWIRHPEHLMFQRLEHRTGHIASVYYAEKINPGFEIPSIPHAVIENSEDHAALHLQLAKLTSETEKPNQALHPTAFMQGVPPVMKAAYAETGCG